MIFEGRFCQFVMHVKENEVLNLILVFDYYFLKIEVVTAGFMKELENTRRF
jgi:hypothetical protein